MEDVYRVAICRGALVDSEIPLLERMLASCFGVSSREFLRAFSDPKVLSFDTAMTVDELQEYVLELEAQGFKVTATKVKPGSSEVRPASMNSRLAELTYDDCSALFVGDSNSINKWVKHKNWVVFTCSMGVVVCYLLMIFYSLN